MAKRRRINAFSLSFLDIMACGFGAVTLLFLILRHNVIEVEAVDPTLAAEINMLEQDIRAAENNKVQAKNSVDEVDDKLAEARGLSRRIVDEIEKKRREVSIQKDPVDEIAELRRQLEQIEKETANLEETSYDDKTRQFLGEGERQYLTGLKLGGERVLILVDSSASMLADTIVNAIRRRNMDPESRIQSPKWQWTVRTVEWLVAQLPSYSRFQIYQFSTSAGPVVEDTAGEWLDTADSLVVERTIAALKKVAPADGTSLENAFTAIRDFEQPPDNIFLLTDGLPTQGKKRPRGNTISSKKRQELFNDALNQLPRNITVNTILFPMEGDPVAAASFWLLALHTQGAFLAPSRDWP